MINEKETQESLLVVQVSAVIKKLVALPMGKPDEAQWPCGAMGRSGPSPAKGPSSHSLSSPHIAALSECPAPLQCSLHAVSTSLVLQLPQPAASVLGPPCPGCALAVPGCALAVPWLQEEPRWAIRQLLLLSG